MVGQITSSGRVLTRMVSGPSDQSTVTNLHRQFRTLCAASVLVSAFVTSGCGGTGELYPPNCDCVAGRITYTLDAGDTGLIGNNCEAVYHMGNSYSPDSTRISVDRVFDRTELENGVVLATPNGSTSTPVLFPPARITLTITDMQESNGTPEIRSSQGLATMTMVVSCDQNDSGTRDTGE